MFENTTVRNANIGNLKENTIIFEHANYTPSTKEIITICSEISEISSTIPIVGSIISITLIIVSFFEDDEID